MFQINCSWTVNNLISQSIQNQELPNFENYTNYTYYSYTSIVFWKSEFELVSTLTTQDNART